MNMTFQEQTSKILEQFNTYIDGTPDRHVQAAMALSVPAVCSVQN